ncbi:putative carbohydrate esterase At4g34215 isoform X3 [Carex rostrata]
MSLTLSLLLLIAISQPCVSDRTAVKNDNSESESRKLMFILAGQSNMAGRGGVNENKWDHIIPTECGPHPTILRLNASLHWVEATEPLHADIDVRRTCGVGPGLSFANWIREPVKEGGWRLIGLVPCAVGGTRIQEWSRGSVLYQQMIGRTKAALTSGGKIGAVLWYQGESDTVRHEDAYSYRARLEKLIFDLRTDLHLPHLLFIQVALASGEGPYLKIVREAQKGITLPNVKYVDAIGLKLEGDHLHLTTHAQVQLGNGDSSHAWSRKTKLKLLCYVLLILYFTIS